MLAVGCFERQRIRCALISKVTEAFAHLDSVAVILELFEFLGSELLLLLPQLFLLDQPLLVAGRVGC